MPSPFSHVLQRCCTEGKSYPISLDRGFEKDITKERSRHDARGVSADNTYSTSSCPRGGRYKVTSPPTREERARDMSRIQLEPSKRSIRCPPMYITHGQVGAAWLCGCGCTVALLCLIMKQPVNLLRWVAGSLHDRGLRNRPCLRPATR